MMKLNLSATLFLIALTTFAQKNKSHFKSEIDFGNGTVFTTFFDLTTAKDGFTITSPKNADVRLFGGKAKLGRLLGKSTKKGIFVTISGLQKNDSLFGEANVAMIGKLKFKGVIKNEVLSGEFTNGSAAMGQLHGVNSKEKRNDYNDLYPLLIKTIQDNIYSRDVLQTKEWKNFQKETEALFANAYDDIELYLGFSILTQSLPFTHLNLAITQALPDPGLTSVETVPADSVTIAEPAYKTVVFEEKNNATAYLLIKNFATSENELTAILPKIVANQNYKNLIVDLRDNPGGGIEAAFAFATYITDKDLEVGYFLTNKLQYSGYQPELFQTLPLLQPKNTDDFTNELKATSGTQLIFKKPDNPVFTGAIYILTNGKTGSTSEPVVYALKKSKRALIVGEKTKGAMLAACPFVVSGKYTVVLPIADFYTADGLRLDKVGVNPDVAVKSEDALNKVLEIINGGKI